MPFFSKWQAVFQSAFESFCSASQSVLDAGMGELGSHLKQLTPSTSEDAAQILSTSEQGLKALIEKVKPVISKYSDTVCIGKGELPSILGEAEKIVFESSMKQIGWGFQQLCGRSQVDHAVKGKKARKGLRILFNAMEHAPKVDYIDDDILVKVIKLLTIMIQSFQC